MRSVGNVLLYLAASVFAGVVLAAGVLALAVTGRPLTKSVSFVGPPIHISLPALAVPSRVYDDKGNLIGVLSSSDNRSPVALSAVAPTVIHAILDVEDNTFYQTGPIDLRGIVRALLADVTAGHVVQGGSTITQQLVKNALLSPQRTITRKFNEAVLSIRLAQQMTKGQILDRYLNTVYFGHGAYGVQAAAQTYFNLPASKLDAAQAALLAAMIESPASYDPIAHPKGATFRRNLALQQMVHNHDLTQAQADAAEREPLPKTVFVLQAPPVNAFVNQVIQSLLANPRLGPTPQARYTQVYHGGLNIYTSLDPVLQQDARRAVANRLPNTNGAFTASMIAMDPRNGEVRALISGNPTTPTGYDVATGLGGTGRQAGSSFKVFTLIAALEKRLNPNDLVDGTGPCHVNYPGAQPATISNAEPGYGLMTITKATADSVNCAYVRLGIKVGLADVRAIAHKLGVTSPIPRHSPAIVIGSSSVTPLEMATAYSVLADGGILHNPRLVDRVTNANGKVLIAPPGKGIRVMDANYASIADQVLQQVVLNGTGTAAALPGRQVAGKTGTTDNFADAWFDGYTPQLVASVWMGNPRGEVSMKNVGGLTVYGGTYPARIWHDFMQAALANQPLSFFPAPNLSVLAPSTYIYSRFVLGSIPPQVVSPPTTYVPVPSGTVPSPTISTSTIPPTPAPPPTVFLPGPSNTTAPSSTTTPPPTVTLPPSTTTTTAAPRPPTTTTTTSTTTTSSTTTTTAAKPAAAKTTKLSG